MELSVDRLWNGEHASADEIVRVQLASTADGVEFAVDAPFHGDPAPPGPAGVVDGLWEYEVVELFLLGDGEHYLEVEIGPHGHHLVLSLHGRRRPTRRGLPLAFTSERDAERWRGRATIPWTYVPTGALAANAYAIHGTGEARRYLAWSPVPGDLPDFHRLEHFRPLDLPRP